MDTEDTDCATLIIRHGWTRMDTVFALENSVYSVAIRAQKKKKKYESNDKRGTGV